MRIKYILRRFIRRLQFAFDFKSLWAWGYETCSKCGMDYRLVIDIKDQTWLLVNGTDSGCLCNNCFLKIAQEKNINISLDDFNKLWVFNPNGNSFDIIKGVNDD